jgi:sterol 3beta-glucosyltransferase
MRIGLQTWGSHGDIRPFIMLAAGLQSSGHDVTLVVTSTDGVGYGETASGLGIRLVEVAFRNPAVMGNYLERGRSIVGETDLVRQTERIISTLILPVEAEMYAAAEKLCSDNEVVIGHFFHYPVQTAAEKFHRPYATVALNPGVIPNASFPPAGLPNLGKWGNDYFWGLAAKTLNDNIKPFADRLRRRNGLADAKDLISEVWFSRELNLIAVSAEICGRWFDPRGVHKVCGFFHGAEIRSEGKTPEALEQFLERGSPPVYMTFGSMMPNEVQSQTKVARMLIEAARLAGCRAIIQASLWEECRLPPSEDIFFMGNSPHASVFPNCAAVVHHGGAGTTQAVMAAGIPSIVVPHISDQRFWGLALKRLGVAPDILPRKDLSGKALAGRIKSVLASPRMQARAREVGTSVRKEDGVATAVRWINETYRS